MQQFVVCFDQAFDHSNHNMTRLTLLITQSELTIYASSRPVAVNLGNLELKENKKLQICENFLWMSSLHC